MRWNRIKIGVTKGQTFVLEESCKIIRVNAEEKDKDESNLKEVD